LGGFYDFVPFCDIIFADILTSFSRVLGDLEFVFSDLVLSEQVRQGFFGNFLEVLVPLLIR
jgi:hypothetical protein